MRSRMSIIPKLMSQMWHELERPHRLLDQHFGGAMHPDSFFRSAFLEPTYRRFPFAYYRPWAEEQEQLPQQQQQQGGYSVIKGSKDKFEVALDVQQFKPEEINVKVVDNYFVIEGKHEEKHDDHGIISRHFVRKYSIPEECDPDKASSTLSSDGVLTISAPVKPEALEAKKEKVLKIERIVSKPQSGTLEGQQDKPQVEEKKKMAQSN